jgi:hypothetical protein
MRILAVSGSLRTGSSNATLLRAAAMLAANDVEIVAKFRSAVASADALMISRSGVAQERTTSLDGRKNLDARAMMDDPEISSALRWVIQDLR